METTAKIKTKKTQAGEDKVSLRDILDFLLLNWKWFALSIVLCVGVAILKLLSSPNVYQREAVILVKDDQGYGGRPSGNISTDALMQLNGVMMGSSVRNEVYILQSNQLMTQVVKKLHLDVSYTMETGLKTVSLYDVKPIEVTFLSDFELPVSFVVRPLSKDEYKICEVTVKGEEVDYECTARYGQVLEGPFGKMTVTPQEADPEIFEGKDIRVGRCSVTAAVDAYRAGLRTGEVDKESTLVRLVFTDSNVKRADDVLNAILEAYNQSIIEDKNKIAQSTANFINERIVLISKELGTVEGRLATFKQQNKLVDLEQNARTYLDMGRLARERTIQIESQVSVADYLLDYLKDDSRENDLIPAMAGVGDAGIQKQIADYNAMMLERNRLVVNSGEKTPVVEELDANLKQMRQAVVASMTAYASSLNVQLTKAKQEERGLDDVLTSVPAKEQQVLDIAREQAIKETLYTYLLNKREETALQLAITEANIRVIEKPFGRSVPISPRPVMTLFVALVLAFLLPAAILITRDMLNVGVRGRKDVEAYTTIPVLGEIPHRKDGLGDEEIVVSLHSNDTITEAFRMMRFSLDFVEKTAQAIMFTSTMPGEGKTFVSRNFAATLSMAGKRVILVDTDIRRRTQSRLAGQGTREGLTSYLTGSKTDIKELIVPLAGEYKVDFLPAGILPPNPAELLMSSKLDECIADLKKLYDYVIIDNVPAQVVADAGIVNRVADVTLYVIRDGKIDRRFLPELEQLYLDNMFNRLYVVLNDCRMKRKKYGYGRYGYGYGYGYTNKE